MNVLEEHDGNRPKKILDYPVRSIRYFVLVARFLLFQIIVLPAVLMVSEFNTKLYAFMLIDVFYIFYT